MKIKFLLYILCLLVLNNNLVSFSKETIKLPEKIDKKKKIQKNNNITKEENKVLPKDFRDVNWNDSYETVLVSEKTEPVLKEANYLEFKDLMFGSMFSITYEFKEDKLIKAECELEQNFKKKAEPIYNFMKFKKMFKSMYGKPVFDDSKDYELFSYDSYDTLSDFASSGSSNLSVYWETNKTKVYLLLEEDTTGKLNPYPNIRITFISKKI